MAACFGFELERFGSAEIGGVTGSEEVSVELDRSFGEVKPGMAILLEIVFNFSIRLQTGEREVGVLVDGHGIVASCLAGGEMPFSGGGVGHLSFRVAWGDSVFVRLYPDLKEVHGFVGRRIELAVHDAGTGGHVLEIAGLDDAAVAHGVLVLELAAEHVGYDFHVLVGVCAEAFARQHDIVVDDA